MSAVNTLSKTKSAQKTDRASPDFALEKPFALAKYFSTIAIVIIFAASLSLAGLVSRQAENIVKTRVEADTVMLMENLTHQMFLRFLVPMALERGGVRLREPEQYELLNSVILNTIHGFDVSQVLIYDLDGNVVYSTEAEAVGQLVEDMGAYLEAIRLKTLKTPPGLSEPKKQTSENESEDDRLIRQLRSESINKLVGGSYLIGNFFPHGTFSIHSFKAMENYGAGSLTGVLELRRDLSPEYKEIAQLQYFALGFAVLITLLLTLVLQRVVSRGAKIINQKNLEREKLKEQLDQAERLANLGSMVATVAHEIRNPLGIIHSTADLLKSFLEESPKEAKFAEAIVEEADRLSEIVTEFLDFARPQTPKLIPTIIEDLLEELLAFLEVSILRANVELKVMFRDEPGPIMADEAMLHRAFLNILVNAIQAMPEGGLLSVATKLDNEVLRIAISDTGTGLSPEAAGKVFSPFYTTKAKGSGLGLVIVRNIIESHKGEIKLEPNPSEDGEAAGVTVYINLPTVI